VFNVEDALNAKPAMAFLTNPAPFHVPTAIELATVGVHLLVEKPISDRLERLAELRGICSRSGSVLMVGYPFRYSASLGAMRCKLLSGAIGRPLHLSAEVGQYLPDWRPGTDYRNGVTARRELGGGALLELSHELDYAQWLLGDIETVSATVRKLSSLEIDTEDAADLLVEFRNGAAGNIHLDLIQRAKVRRCKVFGEEGTLTWNGLTGAVRFRSGRSNAWRAVHESNGHEEMYLAELKHFLSCARGEATPRTDCESAARTLAIVLAARESSAERRVIRP